MAKYPETQLMLEQAIRHIIDELEKLIKDENFPDLRDAILSLNDLSRDTCDLLVEGVHNIKSVKKFIKKAKSVEKRIDSLSEQLWRPIQISLSAIYERIETSLSKPEGKQGLRVNTRAHYHNLRIRLLEQLLGSRMLIANSDLGDEQERIWQQFLERHLGSMYRVLRGGHICDYEGNVSSQIDLVIVPANANIVVPGDSDDGKVQVMVDQVISAIMVTSNLTKSKLKGDWKNLQSIPSYKELEKDYPQLKGHPWPLFYIVAAQSDTSESLENAWKESCESNPSGITPQFIISLDTGFLYGGHRKWPCPRYPGNYTEAGDVNSETGVYAGLGLAWLLTQQQGRLAVIHNQSLAKVQRFSKLLDEAMLRPALPSIFSPRFNTSCRNLNITEKISWGSTSRWVHNNLQLCSINVEIGEVSEEELKELLKTGVDPKTLDWKSRIKHLRWFRCQSNFQSGRFLALEEWIDYSSNLNKNICISVFDIFTGEEIVNDLTKELKNSSDIESFASQIE